MAAKPFLRRLNCVKLKIILANRTKIYSLGVREREREREREATVHIDLWTHQRRGRRGRQGGREREREKQLCILINELTRREEMMKSFLKLQNGLTMNQLKHDETVFVWTIKLKLIFITPKWTAAPISTPLFSSLCQLPKTNAETQRNSRILFKSKSQTYIYQT